MIKLFNSFLGPWCFRLGLFFLLAHSLHAGLTPKQIYEAQSGGVLLVAASLPGQAGFSQGAGFLIRADGLAVTAAHLLKDPSSGRDLEEITVFFKPAQVRGDNFEDLKLQARAKVAATDPNLDLAMLRIEGSRLPAGVHPLVLGDPNGLGPGDLAVAIGHPEQGVPWAMSTGLLSGEISGFEKVEGRDVFQMETSLNRGNSGGPLFDERGYVIGVNTAFSRQAKDGLAITGINFALKSSVLKTWLRRQKIPIHYGPLPHDDLAIATAYRLDNPAVSRAAFADLAQAPSGFALKIRPQRGENATYRLGESMGFVVRSQLPCHLYLLHRDSQGAIQVLFPNSLSPESLIQAGQAVDIPSRNQPFELEAAEPEGQDVIQAVASLKPIPALEPGQTPAGAGGWEKIPGRLLALPIHGRAFASCLLFTKK